ncbi:hypothetical protein L3X07_13970 [Levilactobacillus brevis]|nr:hypothetical protein [Levilactobacillus brevis]
MHRQQDYDHPVQLGRELTLRNGYCLAPLSTQTALFNGEVSRNDCYFHQQHAKYVGLDIVGQPTLPLMDPRQWAQLVWPMIKRFRDCGGRNDDSANRGQSHSAVSARWTND